MDLSVTAVLDAARAADPAGYRVGGRAPGAAWRPESAEEVAELLLAATRDRFAVMPWGGGVSLPHEEPPERYDVAIDLGALAAIVDHEPDDLTLIAQAGATLATLRAACAAGGQELPLEAARAARATLGGVLAANASGARRRRFGAPRDRVLGMRFALGDGTLARAGGRVVKNVAGFGLQRLLCGSRGGLAIVLEASLKLVPAARERVLLTWAAAAWPGSTLPAGAMDVAALTWLRGFPLDGVAATAARAGVLMAALEDDAPAVAGEERRLRAALGEPLERLEGAAVGERLQLLADLEEHPAPRLTLSGPPPQLPGFEEWPEGVALVFHAAAGRLHAFPGEQPWLAIERPAGRAGFVRLDARGGEPPTQVIPAERSALEVRERIRGSLDPGRVLSLGGRWVERG